MSESTTTSQNQGASAESAPAAALRPPRDYAMFDADLSARMLNLSLLGRLLHWLVPYRLSLLFSAGLILIASTLQVILPIIISLVVVDHIIMQNTTDSPDLGMVALTEWLAQFASIEPLLAACALYAVAQLGWALSGHHHRLLLNLAVIRALQDLRHDLFAHLETRPSSFFDRVQIGRIMTRVTNDVEALYELLRGLGTLIGEFVPFFVALAIMLAIDVQLTLILLLVIPVMAVVTSIFRRATQQQFRLVRQSVSSLNQFLQENLAGMQVVQLSQREAKNRDEYGGLNADNRRHELRSARLETLYGAFTDSMAHVAIGIIIWYAGGEVVQDRLSLGGVILFTRFIDMLFHPIVVLGEQTNILFRAMASGERIFQALDWDEKIHEPPEPAQLPERLAGQVEFRNLSFRYEPDTPVLEDVSFSINAGEKMAIVGPTGSGKSTLIRLLGRFYEFPDNHIFLDEVDLNHIHTQDLRRRIGVVLQDFHIFSGTVLDNIALGNPGITRERAEQAARTVNAHSFISALPAGYDTELAERGSNLSQGQRQLLAFARVLAADPEILILDEATASIDTETELLIQDALRKLTANRTSILIAHRLQTIQEANRILVLDHGRVAELGTHDELLELGGLYHTLHNLQFQESKGSEPQNQPI